MAFFAPYVNSYRRLVRNSSAPINIRWGRDNRTVGIRVPRSSPEARRVENRVIGADANPYVATAVTLACGYLGMQQKIEPTEESSGNAYQAQRELPRSLSDALENLERAPDLAQVLGPRFAKVYRLVKELEYDEFMKVISPWEREHLLLHV
jgi:glutamine synthetase